MIFNLPSLTILFFSILFERFGVLMTLLIVWCVQVGRNICHGSDSVDSANKEIALWFKPEELCSWDSCQKDWIYE